MNANELIKDALIDLVVIEGGSTPSTTQYATGLRYLNNLLSSWSAQINLVYEDTREELTIPSSTQSFTIGASGDQVTGRPLKITRATIKDGNIEYPVKIIDEAQYQSFSDKSSTGQPFRLYYRNTFPNGTVYFEFTTGQTYTLVLTSIKQLTSFADGTTEYDLPEHYKRALVKNLAIEIAPAMGAAGRLTQILLNQAEESKNTIIGLATNIVPSRTDVPRGSRYNINADC